MREIIFRAKREFNGSVGDGLNDFVYGYYYSTSPRVHHIYSFGEHITINADTIQQFIGELDKNRTKIFEGDIVKIPEGYGGDYFFKESIGYVKYEDGGFIVVTKSLSDFHWNELEVIGNIFDNKELLTGE